MARRQRRPERHVGTDHLLLAVKRWKQEVESLRKIAKALLESGAEFPKPASAKLPGDPDALRGIPMTGRGIGGAIRGTRPESETIRRDERHRKSS